MLIAHIPAAYIAAKLTLRRKLSPIESVCVAVGAIFPDFDMIRFYLIDNRQIHHHDYWTHTPFIWLCILAGVYGAPRLSSRKYPAALTLFFMGVFIHMGLDSFAGEIRWLWPISGDAWPLIRVPSTSETWYVSFINHWLFKVEIGICLLAALIAQRSKI